MRAAGDCWRRNSLKLHEMAAQCVCVAAQVMDRNNLYDNHLQQGVRALTCKVKSMAASRGNIR